MNNSQQRPQLSPGVVGFILLLLATVFFWFINDDCLRAINKGNELGAIFFEDGTIQLPQVNVTKALASFGSAIRRSGNGPQQAGFENFKFTQTCRGSISGAFLRLAQMKLPAASALIVIDGIMALIGIILMVAQGWTGRRSLDLTPLKA
jgi:hypothetical protein